MLTEFWTLVICPESPVSPETPLEIVLTLDVRLVMAVEIDERSLSVCELMLDTALVMSPDKVDVSELMSLSVCELMLDTALLM